MSGGSNGKWHGDVTQEMAAESNRKWQRGSNRGSGRTEVTQEVAGRSNRE